MSLRSLLAAFIAFLLPMLTDAQTAIVRGTPMEYISVANGMKCDDSTDDTTAFNAILTKAYNAGGGMIMIVGTCLIDGQVILPNNNASIPSQPFIRIEGIGSTSGYVSGATTPGAPSALDFRYDNNNGVATGIADIDTRGEGILEIDHLLLEDLAGASDATPFIQTTNTTLDIHDDAFSESGVGAGGSYKDVIIFGGGTASAGGGSTAMFQGYGTVIKNNFFGFVRRIEVFNGASNGVQTVDNTISANAGYLGPALPSGPAFSLSDSRGNYFAGNILELSHYAYGFQLGALSKGNLFVGNQTWDPNATYTISAYSCTAGGGGNVIISAHDDGTGATKFGNCSGPSAVSSNMVQGSDSATLDSTVSYTWSSTTPLTVSGLAAADPSPTDGDAGYVTDAMSCTFGSAVSGSGSTHCRVHYDGSSSSWKAG